MTSSPSDRPREAEATDPEQLLTAEQAAAKLALPVSWVFRNGRALGFAVKIDGRYLRFSSNAIDRYIAGLTRQSEEPVTKHGTLRIGRRIVRRE